MTTTAIPIGLTTGKAPFIENARQHGDIYIQQPVELYSEENQETWRRLYARMRPRWEKYANPKFLEGVSNLALDPNAVPKGDPRLRLGPSLQLRRNRTFGHLPQSPALSNSIGMGHQPGLRDRQIPAAAVHRAKLRTSVRPDPHAGGMDHGRQGRQRRP